MLNNLGTIISELSTNELFMIYAQSVTNVDQALDQTNYRVWRNRLGTESIEWAIGTQNDERTGSTEEFVFDATDLQSYTWPDLI